MANTYKAAFLEQMVLRFGPLEKLPGSQSLYSVGGDAARIYIRYSKLHDEKRTFFGLREVDLRQLEGHNSFLCFLADTDAPPVFVPYADFEEIFREAHAASDGQYKAQLLLVHDGLELYVARCGRFNVEAYAGFETIERAASTGKGDTPVSLSHSGVQTLLAAVGNLKGYDVWIPAHDACRLEWALAKPFKLRPSIPRGYSEVEPILSEIDVVWVTKSRDAIQALFEVEHTTTIYSGLLRFNDLLLSNPRLSRFSIVSNESRRAIFSRQLFRPTFQRSGLAEVTSFLEYRNVYDWHSRLSGGRSAQSLSAARIDQPVP